jgi:hypothetical protein
MIHLSDLNVLCRASTQFPRFFSKLTNVQSRNTQLLHEIVYEQELFEADTDAPTPGKRSRPDKGKALKGLVWSLTTKVTSYVACRVDASHNEGL